MRDRKTLENYRANKRLIERNLEKINDEQCRDIPVVSGKVVGSSSEFPYLEQRFPILMEEPSGADRQRKRITEWRAQIKKAEGEILEAERFISTIPDAMESEILTMYYLDGSKRPTQSFIAHKVGYTQGRVSQIIAKYFKINKN